MGWRPREALATPWANARFRLGVARQLFRASHALRRAARRASTAEEIVRAVFEVPYGVPPPQPAQVRSEITAFLELIKHERPRHVLEIGTSYGGILFLLAWASSDDARVLSLDVRDLRYRLRFYRSFGRRKQEVHVVLSDSSLEETRTVVRSFFHDKPLDLPFIDGDHSYSGVRRDYELYAPLVRRGGPIALHDIVDGPEKAVGGVPRFWRELKGSEPDPTEIVESWSQGGYGIGVLRQR